MCAFEHFIAENHTHQSHSRGVEQRTCYEAGMGPPMALINESIAMTLANIKPTRLLSKAQMRGQRAVNASS